MNHMTAEAVPGAPPWLVPEGGWTDEALEHIPEGIHYEIQDGRIIVSPRPSFRHQKAATQMANLLDEVCPPEWTSVQEGEIRTYAGGVITDLRAPGILVGPASLTTETSPRGWAHPHEVPIAVEVLSPGSARSDRGTKVTLYASWGIRLYLRLETGPEPVLYVHRLARSGTDYRPPSRHTEPWATDDPFPLTIDPAGFARPAVSVDRPGLDGEQDAGDQ